MGVCVTLFLKRGGGDFIYVFIEVIGTCMQNFKKIDLKKNSTFFNQSCSALFLLQTVHIRIVLIMYLKSLTLTQPERVKKRSTDSSGGVNKGTCICSGVLYLFLDLCLPCKWMCEL